MKTKAKHAAQHANLVEGLKDFEVGVRRDITGKPLPQKANVRKAVEFIKQAFGVKAKKVWNEKGAALFEVKFESPLKIPMKAMFAQALEFFGEAGIDTVTGLGVSGSIEAKFDNHRVLVSRYRNDSTVHILLVDDQTSPWWNAI